MRRRRLKWTWEQVYRRMHELADGNTAPSKDRWDQQRGADMPSCYMMLSRGYTWEQIVEAAGLKRAPAGNKQGSKKGFSAQPVPAAAEAYVQQALATSEPPRPRTWPLFGIPTRTQIFRGQLPDGTLVRVTRQYYSLR